MLSSTAFFPCVDGVQLCMYRLASRPRAFQRQAWHAAQQCSELCSASHPLTAPMIICLKHSRAAYRDYISGITGSDLHWLHATEPLKHSRTEGIPHADACATRRLDASEVVKNSISSDDLLRKRTTLKNWDDASLPQNWGHGMALPSFRRQDADADLSFQYIEAM